MHLNSKKKKIASVCGGGGEDNSMGAPEVLFCDDCCFWMVFLLSFTRSAGMSGESLQLAMEGNLSAPSLPAVSGPGRGDLPAAASLLRAEPAAPARQTDPARFPSTMISGG